MRRLIRHLNSSIGGGAILIAFFSIVSKLLGLIRDRLLASQFGADRALDIYFAAFKIPDLLFNILILGALTSAFIPVFQRRWREDQAEGLRLANSALNFFLIAILVLSVFIWLLAPQILGIFLPGFEPSAVAEAVQLTKILLFSLIFFTASNILSGVLNSWRKFFTFALSSVMYNVGIILGIVVGAPRWGLSGIMYGVVLGAFLHFFVQYLEAHKHGWHYQLVLRLDSHLRRIMKLMIPRTIGLAGSQFSIVIVTSVASALPVGSLAIYNLANNLQSFPIGIFGISLAVASFPSFTRLAHPDTADKFKELLSLQFRRILYFLVPISLLILMLRAQLVRVILGAGAFNWQDTILTANSLGIFALSVFAQGLIPLFARAFYAYEDTRSPVIISLLSVALNIILALLLAPTFGVIGLTIAFTISNLINLVVLIIALRLKLGDLQDAQLSAATARIVSAAVAASLCTYGTLWIMSQLVDMHRFVGILLQGFVAGAVGLVAYVAISLIARYPEIDFTRSYLVRLLKLLRGNGYR